jgi:hypothetical protein
MATKLHKTVSRELNRVRATKRGRVEIPDANGYIPMDARAVIASLRPSDVLEFRVKGTKRRTELPLHLAMILAGAYTEHLSRQEKKRQQELKKNAGHKRLRKIRKVYNPQAAAILRKLYNTFA